MQQYLDKLINHENLTIEEMKATTNHGFTDTITDTEIASSLTPLRSKGETADEVTGIVDIIRSQSDLSSITMPNVMDNCGTGGDKSYSFNISTTSPFVIAGAGVKVAKHGNRSISSKTDSENML